MLLQDKMEWHNLKSHLNISKVCAIFSVSVVLKACPAAVCGSFTSDIMFKEIVPHTAALPVAAALTFLSCGCPTDCGTQHIMR